MENALYEGKSKVICQGKDADTYIMFYKDTATAFDGKKKEELTGKGALNAKISNLIYSYLEKHGIKTHLVEVVDDVTCIVKKAEIINVEVIIRNVAAGSFSKKYGVPEGTALKNTTHEFSLKDDALGDPMINESMITALGLATSDELAEMTRIALKINDLLCDLFMKIGIRLVDFKLEFGRSKDGLILCDEISPDSCRFWDAKDNSKMDKDRFRRDMGGVIEGYTEVLRRLSDAVSV